MITLTLISLSCIFNEIWKNDSNTRQTLIFYLLIFLMNNVIQFIYIILGYPVALPGQNNVNYAPKQNMTPGQRILFSAQSPGKISIPIISFIRYHWM